MEIRDVSIEEYKTFVVKPFSEFDTCDFIELNKHKVDRVKYFIFNNSKNRFGLVAGIKDNTLKIPFSATFSCFSEIAHNNKIIHYYSAVKALVEWAKNQNIKRIIICTPPIFYDTKHITKFQNALICNGFKVLDYDVNFQYDVHEFSQNYIDNLSSNSRRNLKIALKSNLSFEKTDDIESVYKIIKQNRKEKGFPLWMSLEDIKNTESIIKSDYFIVSNAQNEKIASAYIQHIKQGIVNIVYWGNIQKYDNLCPVNFMGYKIFEYYSKKKNINYVSIGTSTLDSIPNTGLCDFKESIGCSCSPKLNFVYNNIKKG